MAVSDYKTDPNENTTISGINIAEGCPPSGVNNALRQLMADVKAMYDAVVKTVNGNAPSNGNITPAQTGCLPLTGGTMTGGINIDVATTFADFGYSFANSNGALLAVRSKNYSQNPGGFELVAKSSTDGSSLVGTADGHITWCNSAVFLPAGAVFAFAANYDPAGCLLCNGAAVSRTTYADLFAAIGTTYGEGDGSTTFNLPNLTDKFIQGSGTAGTYLSAGLPNIIGYFTSLRHRANNGEIAGSVERGGAIETTINFLNSSLISGENVGSSSFEFNASFFNTIYGNSTTVQPPAITMRYYIKY